MLKGVNALLGAELLYVLASMGHGDELALVDCNFPASSTARRLVVMPGIGIIAAGEAILSVMPLDEFVDEPVIRMAIVGAPAEIPPVQQEFHTLCESVDGRRIAFGSLSRLEFYERAKSTFVVVSTGETRPYGCFILTKGIIGGIVREQKQDQ